MITRSQKIRLGIFLSISTVLLLIIFVIVAGNRLMEKRDHYYIQYQNISVIGLQVGSSVKYYGINIGQVEDITIDKKDISNVNVEISVKRGTPIKEDVVATLVSVGITGIKQIELTGGSNEAELLPPNSNIQPGISYIDDITGKAEKIAEKFELLLNNFIALTAEDNRLKVGNILNSTQALLEENRKVLNSTLGNMNTMLEENRAILTTSLNSFNQLIDENRKMLSELLSNTNNIIEENREPLRQAFSQIDSSSSYMLQFMRSAHMSMAKLDTVLANTTVFSEKLATTDIAKLTDEMSTTLNNINNTFTHVDLTVLKARQDLLKSIDSFKQSAEYLSEFSRKINEDPSILLRSKR
ncbi:MAG: MlaD family protein [Candidatus Marinimicrobia bacterium]|nr:MCE family protein [bacterium]MCG2715005.1 MlaD family protein [Candidatus Neomarinimicrobiota bacterium]